MTTSKIVFFGESHVQAVKTAIRKANAPATGPEVSAYRLTKIKNGRLIGDIHFEDLKLICAELTENDLVVSVVGGNQHNAFGLIQHPHPFDIAHADGTADPVAPGVTMIPRNAVKDVFLRGMRKNSQQILEIAQAGPYQTAHMVAPPPKADNAHILSRIEADFVSRGVVEKGVSPAALRYRTWELQNEALRMLLTEGNVLLLPPPESTTTPEGFLKPEYYAQDATHANAAYGAKLLEQASALSATRPDTAG